MLLVAGKGPNKLVVLSFETEEYYILCVFKTARSRRLTARSADCSLGLTARSAPLCHWHCSLGLTARSDHDRITARSASGHCWVRSLLAPARITARSPTDHCSPPLGSLLAQITVRSDHCSLSPVGKMKRLRVLHRQHRLPKCLVALRVTLQGKRGDL